jgi:hypothetical protein
MIEDCSICLREITDPISGLCSHRFCRECICPWLENHNTCPLCRSIFSNILLDYLPYTQQSLIGTIGLDKIHTYTINNIINQINIIKGTTPDITDSEKEMINTLCGFNVLEKITNDITNIFACVLRHNIITIGKKENINDNKYIMKGAIVIIRNTGTTFPVFPKNTKYNNSIETKIYQLDC